MVERTAYSSGKNVSSSARRRNGDAARAAGAGLAADHALHRLEVPEPPELEVLLDVDELLAGLVHVPVVLGVGVDVGEDVHQLGAEDVGAADVAVEQLPRHRVAAPGEQAQELVVDARAVRAARSARRARARRARTARSIAAFLLPSRNSTARYCADWNPDDEPSDAAELGVLGGVSVASTDHCSMSVFWMCLTRASFFSAGASRSAARSSQAERSSWSRSFSHSSEVWCWTMNSSSSWCSGLLRGCWAASSSSRCR